MPHNYLPAESAELKAFLSESDVSLNYIREVKTRIPPGVSVVGDLTARVRALWSMVGEVGDRFGQSITLAPGDGMVQIGEGADAVKVGLSLPIAYDVWYLFFDVNILRFGGQDIEDSLDKMTGFFDALKNVEEIKSILCPTEAPQKHNNQYFFREITSLDIRSASEQVIKEARFETVLKGKSVVYPSEGPREDYGSDFAGYISFPVGQLGVMSITSVVTETMFSGNADYEPHTTITPNDAEAKVLQGETSARGIFPPWDNSVEKVAGENIVTKGYVIDDETMIEYPADRFTGLESVQPLIWMRYWIKRENNTIIPGEFTALICRPYPLHVWWYNQSSPFVYSGHWIETEFYTSGTVMEVLEDDEYTPVGDEVGKRYRVRVKNEDVWVKSSDFYPYEVNDRVGIMKTYWADASASGDGTWQGLVYKDSGDTVLTDWVIVPVDFYSAN